MKMSSIALTLAARSPLFGPLHRAGPVVAPRTAARST
jgi:hypothetical protein